MLHLITHGRLGFIRKTLVAGLTIVLLGGANVGCGMSDTPIYSATASIPAETLQQGTVLHCFVGGVMRYSSAIMGLLAVKTENGQPVAELALAYDGGPNGNGIYTLHLGETVTVPGTGTITLVSFDEVEECQAITILYQY